MLPYGALDGAIVSFLNYKTSSAIDLDNGKSNNGALVAGYQFHGGKNQQWKLEQVDKSTVWPKWMIRNVQSGTYIDLCEGSSANGAKIHCWSGDKYNPNQQWYLVSADPSGGAFMIQNVRTGTYIDLNNGNYADGTTIHGWEGAVQNKNPNNLWRIVV
ncbi:carbohydrate-binding module family 13 protein [Xylariaceae sp. FL1651]|nr:carbohydrate-binding module family 13 protein [Xylariaceae sp. FL1651]